MARLCRIHVTGVGKESARFNPLTIDLRDALTNSPQDSVIWLRNGGGKTTLISILYSLLVPKASQFLGKVNGKGASLEDFLRPDQLAVVATEWDLSAMGSPRRTVGQALLLKERKLIRKYFSFSEVRGFGFDDLPINGLASPARSLDKLDDALREAQRLHPAMDLLIIDDTQYKWEEHLTNLGLDPGLFRMHLIMNSQEGGASEIFKIKTATEFVKCFLELVYDEQSTEEIETTLKLFRQKLALNPSYRTAVEFGEGLLRHLRPFAQDAARKRDLGQEQAKLDHEMTLLAVSVEERLTRLRADIQTLQSQAQDGNQAAETKEKEARRAERFARGYEKHARRQLVDETGQILAQAKETSVVEERKLRIVKAAKTCQIARAGQAELTALQQNLDELRREHRPELDKVRGLGARLRSAWDRRIGNLQANRVLTKETIDELKKSLRQINVDRAEFTGRSAKAAGQRDQAQAAIRRYEEAQRKLRTDGVLREGEIGTASRARWEEEVMQCTARFIRLKEEIGVVKNRLSSLGIALTNVDGQIRMHMQERTRLQTKLATEERSREQLEKLPIIAELGEGETPDLRNHFLLEALDARIGEAQSELVRLGVETADDKRDDQSLERGGLFAPSVDVEEVLARLKQIGVTSALPFYRWLDEHCTSEEAAARLRAHPAACAGILVQNPTQLDLARRELDHARIRTPVVLLSAADLPASWKGEFAPLTIIPEERGLFSKAEAAGARLRIEQRRQSQADRKDHAEARFNAAHSAATLLRGYLREHPADAIASLRTALDAVEALLVSLEADKDRLAIEQTGLGERQEEAHVEQVRAGDERGRAERRRSLADTFVEEHEEPIDGHRRAVEQQQKLHVEAEKALRQVDEKEPGIQDALTAAHTQAEDLRLDCDKAETSRGLLPGEYCGPPPAAPEARAPEELAPAFAHTLAAYEGTIRKGELEGEITVQRRVAARADADYTRARGSLPKDEVEAAADGEDAIDVAIDRQQIAFNEANSAEAVADKAHRGARAVMPDEREFKEGGDLDLERGEQPGTSQASLDAMEEYREAAARHREESAEARRQERIALDQLVKRQVDLPGYESWQEQLPPADGAHGHPAFTGVGSEDRQLVHGLVTQKGKIVQGLANVESRLIALYDQHIHPHISQSAYNRFRIPFREKLERLHRGDLEANADRHIHDVDTQIQVCRNELDSEEQERRTIVDKLDALARRAANLLGQAETVSTMPDAIAPWAQQPFLQLNVPKKNDLAERQVLLRQAIERWFDKGEIPAGHQLAHECLLAVCGTKPVGVRILKPEYHLSPVAKDITELVTFSDGEKLTAAILLYCVLVRLRARQKIRAEHLLSKDSGMLLLDNPFGKATLAEFVDLQVRMARLMGVQLIYATGINDPAALKHFPHYVRLRNNSRGKSSNDYHVTHDPRPLEGDREVEGVILGRTESPAAHGA